MNALTPIARFEAPDQDAIRLRVLSLVAGMQSTIFAQQSTHEEIG